MYAKIVDLPIFLLFGKDVKVMLFARYNFRCFGDFRLSFLSILENHRKRATYLILFTIFRSCLGISTKLTLFVYLFLFL